MARRKPLPPGKGQRYGRDYVRQELVRRTRARAKAAARAALEYTEYRAIRAVLDDKIEERKFGSSSAAEGDVEMTYVPTNTTWPGNNWDHRRTTEAGYNRNTGILAIEFFTDGSIYHYGTSTPVPPAVARAFRRAASPGKFINSTLEGYGYERIR